MPEMVRSWEHTRSRKLARQAVLCAALGLVTALAWWVGYVRDAALRVELGLRQTLVNKVLTLELRLPPSSDWTLKAELENESARLEISESKSAYDTHRAVTILLRRLHPTGSSLLTPEQFVMQDMDYRIATKKAKLDFLGQSGILMQYAADSGDNPTGHPMWSVIYACAVVPLPEPTAVGIWMESPMDLTGADVELVRHLAQELSPVDPAHPAPAIPTVDLQPIDMGTNRQTIDDTTDDNDRN